MALVFWLMSQGRSVLNPLFKTKRLITGKEALRVAKSRAARNFLRELKQINEAALASTSRSDKFNKRFIFDEWQNIMYTFCNSILLAHQKKPLEYPYVKGCFQQ